MPNFDLINLPLELKRRVASFLAPKDAIGMTQSCKVLYSSVAVSFLRPSHLVFRRNHWNGHPLTGDQPKEFVRLPIIDLSLHSVTLTFRWRDQGWGNRKSEIFVIAKRADALGDPDERFEGGRIVCQSGIAAHEEETCKMTFCPLGGEAYTLWYKVGAGGGHVLHVEAGVMHTAIFDDEERNYTRIYFQLHKVGALTHVAPSPGLLQVNLNFYLNMLLRVTRLIRRDLSQGISPDGYLATILQEINIPLTEGSLLALEEIVQANIDHNELTRSLEPGRQPGADANARTVDEISLRAGLEPDFFGVELSEPVNPPDELMFGRRGRLFAFEGGRGPRLRDPPIRLRLRRDEPEPGNPGRPGQRRRADLRMLLGALAGFDQNVDDEE